tara:strand:+ start:273 stop:620 length:348 start_codon:yes stop_codon:yes gene_type:complete
MKVRALQKPKTLAELKRELKCTANPVTRWALKEIIKKKGARQMNNADKPAMPIPRGVYNNDTAGLTKLEHFAGLAMQGLLAVGYYIDDSQNRLNDVPSEAINLADALLKQLEQDK